MAVKVTKRGLASIYRKAANLIDEFGWCTQVQLSPSGEFCALGALNMAAVGDVAKNCTRLGPVLNSDLSKRAECQVLQQCPKNAKLLAVTIVRFNDSVAENREDVTSCLRKIARHLEHGGGQ